MAMFAHTVQSYRNSIYDSLSPLEYNSDSSDTFSENSEQLITKFESQNKGLANSIDFLEFDKLSRGKYFDKPLRTGTRAAHPVLFCKGERLPVVPSLGHRGNFLPAFAKNDIMEFIDGETHTDTHASSSDRCCLHESETVCQTRRMCTTQEKQVESEELSFKFHEDCSQAVAKPSSTAYFKSFKPRNYNTHNSRFHRPFSQAHNWFINSGNKLNKIALYVGNNGHSCFSSPNNSRTDSTIDFESDCKFMLSRYPALLSQISVSGAGYFLKLTLLSYDCKSSSR